MNVNYTILPTDGGYKLTIYSLNRSYTVSTVFTRYIYALAAVQTLQLHLTQADKQLAA
jgi:hypothetical protein